MSPSLAARACPVCGSKNVYLQFRNERGNYRTLNCRQCALAFSFPRPTEQELREFYSSGYYTGKYEGHGYVDYHGIGTEYMKRVWREVKLTLKQFDISPSHLLDIGCATGVLLAQAKDDGWRCTGVEMIEEAAEIARLEYGINVIVGDVLSVSLPTSHYGLATLWHIVEHLIDPIAVLRRVYEVLMPGGYLYIEVPNWASLGRIIRGPSWAALKPPEHITFFNPDSLSFAARKCGFAVIQVTTHYPSIADRAAVPGREQPLYKVAHIAAKIACNLGAGGNMRLLARKPL